jgi:hypothetical protein
MTRSPKWMAKTLALLMLAGSATAVSAQTQDQDDARHPNGAPATEAAPAPQASPGESQPGTGMMGQGMMGQGMMGQGMTPEMMQMMMGQRQGRMGLGMMRQRGPRMGARTWPPF